MSGSTLSLTMRPREFSEVIGLETQVATLKAKLDTGDVPRAFLLKGMFGCGKTTLAYIIAKEVQGWEFTGRPVVQEINAADFTGIDAIRALILEAGSYPMAGKYGVIILDEAHKLSKPAQECLLKAFENANSPTVWIVCTTEPEKLNEGLRDRCFTLAVQGMNETERKELVERAAKELDHKGDLTEFLAAVTKAKVQSPRKILQAFETFHAGTPAGDAVGAMAFEALPEHHEIAMGALFGQWSQPYSQFGGKQVPAVCEQIRTLDERLKKKAKETASDTDENDTVVDADDLEGRPAVAQALRALTCAMLKNQIAKESKKFKLANATKAANCLQIMANCLPPNSFGLEFPLVVGALFRVNQIMTAKG